MFDGTKIAHLADANIYEDLCFEKKKRVKAQKNSNRRDQDSRKHLR